MNKPISIVLELPTSEKDEKGNTKTKKKTFIAPEIKGRMLRRAIEFQKIDESTFDVTTLDNLVNFIVELFGNKFTVDDVYDGINIKLLFPTLMKCVNEVINQFNESVNEFPNA